MSRAILPLLLWIEVILIAILLGPVLWRWVYPKRTRQLDEWASDVPREKP